MARELVFEIDKEAKRKGDYSASGELFVIKKAHAIKQTYVLRRSTYIAPVATSRVQARILKRYSYQGEVS
jgi:hypothetical protein